MKQSTLSHIHAQICAARKSIADAPSYPRVIVRLYDAAAPNIYIECDDSEFESTIPHFDAVARSYCDPHIKLVAFSFSNTFSAYTEDNLLEDFRPIPL